MARILREPQRDSISDSSDSNSIASPAFSRSSVPEIEARYHRIFDFSAPLLYFPLRHHSPACSIHLKKTIARYKPDIILIEGPSDAEFLISHIANPGSEPPFCIYYGYDDKEGLISEEQEKFRAYYPFLEYSPEYTAIRAAAELGIPVRFIDLPYASLLVNRTRNTDTRYRYNEDSEYEANSYSIQVARKAGFRSYAEFWEARYEIPGADTETDAFVRAMFYMASFMRMSEEADDPGERLENRLREGYMAEHIAAAAKKSSKVLVVCGAFHVPGLLDLLDTSVGGSTAPDKNTLRNYARENVTVHLMPYTFTEMDGRKGYAAGMPFPAYYQEIWRRLGGGEETPENKKTSVFSPATSPSDVFEKTALHFILKTARFLRGKAPVSIPDEVNALSMAKSLASLRGKKAPGVYDIIDGVQSAFVKGDINQTVTAELDYLLRILSGLGAGKIAETSAKWVPPLVLNFRTLCRDFRIKTDTILRQETTLDILKNPAHYRKSQFFHQLTFLKTGFSRRISGPDYMTGASKNLVREIWEFHFNSQVETALIDLSVFGANLAEVCGAIAGQQFRDNMTAAELGKLLIAAELMGLAGFFDAWRDEIDDVLAREGNFVNAVSCLGSLRYLRNLERTLRAEPDAFLLPLIARCYRRGVELMEVGRNTSGHEEQRTCESLRSLYALSVEEPALCNPQSFADKVETILNAGFCNSRFYGALLAIHEKQGRINMEELARRINARLLSDTPGEAASFIGGVFLLGRDALLAGSQVLEKIDQVLARIDDDEFLALLPNFRQAFTSFLPAETNRLGQMISQLHKLSPETVLRAERVTQEELSLGLRLDKLAATALEKWGIAQ